MTHTTYSVEALNALPDHALQALLHACTGHSKHATLLLKHRPYTSLDHLQSLARLTWNQLPPEEWLKAFRSYPRLGGDSKPHDRAGRWARKEQVAVRELDEDRLKDVRKLERNYWERHGFPFVICGAENVEQILDERVKNETEQEIFEAGVEHLRVVEVRLGKALGEARNM